MTSSLPRFRKRLFVIFVVLCLSCLFYWNRRALLSYYFEEAFKTEPVEILGNGDGVRLRNYLVPNVVHFFQFDVLTDLSFISATCVLAAHFNHRPDLIVLHTNKNLTTDNRRYLTVVKKVIGSRFEIRIDPKSRPSHVYGQRLTSTFHATDVARIQTLITEGGVALDLDTFVVQPLTGFFYAECTLGWPEGQYIGTQILIARPRARFMQLWLKTYKDYRPAAWYYSAAENPTKHVLLERPDLVHRVKVKFGVHNLAGKLYKKYSGLKWREFYSIHLLARHRDYLVKDDVEESGIEEFDEKNIQGYDRPFGEMARSVWNRPEVKEVLTQI